MRVKKKNIMRTAEEKERIVLEALDKGPNATFQKYDICESVLHRWIKKYNSLGIEGLRSQTGKTKGCNKGNHFSGLQKKKNKTKEEKLQLENLKLKIEVARLKKDTK